MLTLAYLLTFSAATAAFVHPGALHTIQDFERINTHVVNGDEPWNTTWTLLTESPFAQT